MNVLNQHIGNNFAIYHGDSAEVLKELPDNSVDFICHSPPFASLYTYSPSERDLGNCRTEEEFWQHYSFIADELFRLLKPGRLMAVHCQNFPAMKERDGYIGIKDFRGDLIRLHQSDTFIYHSEVCIWKDPVQNMQRTKSIRLLHKQLEKDSAMSGMAIPDYLVTFRKPGENAEPIAGRLEEYAGTDPPQIATSYTKGKPFSKSRHSSMEVKPTDDRRESIEIWQRYASPVWMDINPSLTLQRESAREEADERHICPIQLQVVERALQLWTNPNDVVLSPFAGIGSEGYVSIQKGRKFVGVELKESYFRQAVLNLQNAEAEAALPSLFDFSDLEDAEAVTA